jgi:SAM-dependent methyltransferase
MVTPILEIGAGYKTNYENVKLTPYHTLDHVKDFKPDFVANVEAMVGIVPKNTYNTIIATEVLEHVAEPDKVISNVFELLNAGGRFIITIPFWFGVHEKPWQKDFYRYTPSGIRYLLEKNKFRVELLETKGWRKNRPDNIFVVARKGF